MRNRDKTPDVWTADINRSVADYNDWYLTNSPEIWAEARGKAVDEAAEAMHVTRDFLDLGPAALRARPASLNVVRMAVSPTMVRDRFVGFAGVNKNLVETMEREGTLPGRLRDVDSQLRIMCEFIEPLLDPGLFPWLSSGRLPTDDERDKALLVLGERLAKGFYDPVLRNAQEARQKVELRAYLVANGFEESSAAAFRMKPGEFGMGRNVPAVRADGQAQNMPVDCVVAPMDPGLPLACIELKSAGDFTNVNKRRKEESDKHEALRRSDVVFLLQLFGYFDRAYLGFEASAGIDWAWDHRLADFGPYLGI